MIHSRKLVCQALGRDEYRGMVATCKTDHREVALRISDPVVRVHVQLGEQVVGRLGDIGCSAQQVLHRCNIRFQGCHVGILLKSTCTNESQMCTEPTEKDSFSQKQMICRFIHGAPHCELTLRPQTIIL